MHYHTVTKDVFAFGIQNSARQKMECVFGTVNDDGMSGIGTTIESSTDVIVFSQDVHQLTFALVSPL